MAETLIVRTFAEGLRPLGHATQRNHALIVDALRSRLTPAHALLFCEPVPTPDGVATDWYAQTTGRVRTFDALGPDEKPALRNRLGGLLADVLGIADDPGTDRRLAEAVRNAVEVPSEDAVWLVGDQPVLVNWAHLLDSDKAPRGILRRYIPPPPPRAPAPTAPAAAASGVDPPRPTTLTLRDMMWWAGWLVLALLLIVVLWLLVAPCALRGAGLDIMDLCPKSLVSVIATEAGRRHALEDRVAMLERDLARTGATCRAPPSPEPGRLDAALWEEGDVAVLEGCRDHASDYRPRNMTTGDVLSAESWQMCFDAAGNGSRRLVMTGVVACGSGTWAAFSDLDDFPCSSGFAVFRRTMECDLQGDGEADCAMHRPEAGGWGRMRIVSRAGT